MIGNPPKFPRIPSRLSILRNITILGPRRFVRKTFLSRLGTPTRDPGSLQRSTDFRNRSADFRFVKMDFCTY